MVGCQRQFNTVHHTMGECNFMKNSSIPLVDLSRQVETLGPRINDALARVISNGDFIHGKAVKAFEEEFSEFVGVPHCIGVANGTDALEIALRWLMRERTGTVLVPSMTFIASAEAVGLAGGRVKFVDVDPSTALLTPELVTKAWTNDTVGVVAVHLWGQMCDMEELSRLCRERGAWLLEDCAQAHGARFRGRPAGSWGDAAAFSFYPGKNLGAFGDGGAVTTNNSTCADWVRRYANHGRSKKYLHEMEGRNSRLDTMQAAILRVKLAHLSDWNISRRRLAERYSENLKGVGDLVLPVTRDGAEHVFHLFVVTTSHRDALLDYLANQGIGAGVHYPCPLHLQPAYAGWGLCPGDLPASEGVANSCLSLPLFPEMRDDEIDTVSLMIREYFRSTGHA